jgi:hypothetical protein
MTNRIETFAITDFDGNVVEYVNAYYSETAYYSMPKSTYDAMQAEQAKGKLVNGD